MDKQTAGQLNRNPLLCPIPWSHYIQHISEVYYAPGYTDNDTYAHKSIGGH